MGWTALWWHAVTAVAPSILNVSPNTNACASKLALRGRTCSWGAADCKMFGHGAWQGANHRASGGNSTRNSLPLSNHSGGTEAVGVAQRPISTTWPPNGRARERSRLRLATTAPACMRRSPRRAGEGCAATRLPAAVAARRTRRRARHFATLSPPPRGSRERPTGPASAWRAASTWRPVAMAEEAASPGQRWRRDGRRLHNATRPSGISSSRCNRRRRGRHHRQPR